MRNGKVGMADVKDVEKGWTPLVRRRMKKRSEASDDSGIEGEIISRWCMIVILHLMVLMDSAFKGEIISR